MVKIKLQDISFAPDPSSSKYFPSKFIEWDRSPVKEGDTVFFTDLCLPLAKSSKADKKIAWVIEPAAINIFPYKYLYKNHGEFDLILTHHESLIKALPKDKAVWYPFGGCWVAEKDWQTQPNKTRNISIIASAKNYTNGHALRHEIIQNFKDKIDVFGYGYKPIEEKIEGLKDYRFHITIENCIEECYTTEKLNDPMLCLCVPIYYGPKGINKIFNPKGILKAYTIKDFYDIISIITISGTSVYNDMLPYIKENAEIAKKYIVAEDRIYDILVERGLV